MHKLRLSEEEQRDFVYVFEHFRDEDKATRERQLSSWRRLKLLWEGLNTVYYDAVAHDWRVWDQLNENYSNDQEFYDKRINVFKAYLESIIAALSIVVPPVKCYPDDADNMLDLSTANAGDKIAKMIYRHNDAPLLWLHGLFIFSTEGLTACYNYPRTNEEYGTYKKEKYEEATEEHEIETCPNCGFVINDQTLNAEQAAIPLAPRTPMVAPSQSMDMGMQPDMGQSATPMAPPDMGMMPSGEQSVDPYSMPPDMMNNMGGIGNMGEQVTGLTPDEQLLKDLENQFMPGELTGYEGMDTCPNCGSMIISEIKREYSNITRLVGITDEPKSRVCIEVYGGLNVKIPNYAKTFLQCPYLSLSQEINYVEAVDEFEHLHDNKKLAEQIKNNAGEIHDEYEQWARLSPQYRGEFPENVVTKSEMWLRPCAFNVLDYDKAQKYKKAYKNGVRIVMINDQFGCAYEEAIDDHWTLISNPMSDYLNFTPLGECAVSIQEITNDLISLIIQTVEHGIGQTFADPSVLNFKGYQQTEVTPGSVFPATPRSDKSVADAFHEIKTASLSPEVMPFAQFTQQMGQLATGALPSLFGGQLEGSETASEYSMSKAQALQRLQNTWKMFTMWWKTVFGKCIPMYMKLVESDEKDVERRKDGSFINVFIKKAELEGKIGKVELEANENLPLTWNQQKDIVMLLLQSSSPIIQQFIMAPENLDIVRQSIGLTDFYVPGEDDREKQYEEIKQLLNSKPMPNPMTMDPMAMQMAMAEGQPVEPEISSVPIEEYVDNHMIQYEICRAWLVSEAGRLAKVENPDGYKNILLHAKEHLIAIPPPVEEEGAEESAPGEKPKDASKKEAPINGEADVQTVN